VAQIRQIKDWHSSTRTGVVYERLLASIGTEEFGATVRDSVLAVTDGVRRIYLFEATGRLNTSLQYYFGEPGLVTLFPAYLKSYLRMDPVCDAYLAAPACSDVALQIVRPADIASPGFRQRIFEDAGIVERVSIIQRGPHSWRAMNVARHETHGRFSEDELNALVGLSCLLLPMLPLNRFRQAGHHTLTVPQLEERFRSRYTRLTTRECQVCARAALGMSVEATARDLGIAKTSVVTYRHRAYQRLGVTSPFELCRLVTH
jgi:DNA-binding CsgD family transcriptional regulator